MAHYCYVDDELPYKMAKANKTKGIIFSGKNKNMVVKTITCLKELEERRILELDDIVEFIVKEEVIEYEVWSRFLNLLNRPNNRIFEVLEIDDKHKLAEKIYGYIIIDGGYWPYSNHNDFPALTRLVKELYLIIGEKKMIYTKFTRFEIMEI